MAKATDNAPREIKELRSKAHISFDRIWRRGHMSRGAAYKWLAEQLGLTREECHMLKMTTKAPLLKVIRVSDNFVGRTVIEDDFASEPPLPPIKGKHNGLY